MTIHRTPARLDLLFGTEVATCEGSLPHLRGYIFPEEEAIVHRAAFRRKAEFFAGRICAREALAKIGIRAMPILRDRNGSPVWCPGVVGSISHTNPYCAAAVARKGNIRGLGLDIEYARRVTQDIWRLICTRDELEWVYSLPSSAREESAGVIFSAKESLFKCQYGVTGMILDFHDICSRVDRERAHVSFRAATGRGQTVLNMGNYIGRFHYEDGVVITGVIARRCHDGICPAPPHGPFPIRGSIGRGESCGCV